MRTCRGAPCGAGRGRSLAGGLSPRQCPRSVFKQAIERGNLLIAEMTAKELGRLTLADALDLLVLEIEKEPGNQPLDDALAGATTRPVRQPTRPRTSRADSSWS